MAAQAAERPADDGFGTHMLEHAAELDGIATLRAFEGQEARLGEAFPEMSDAGRQARLRAVADGDVMGDTADAFVTSAFVYATPSDLRNADTQRAMADALAATAYEGGDPRETARRNLAADRLAGVLAEGGGRELLLSEDIQPEVRAWALENVLSDARWNGEALSDGWGSDVVTTAFAEQTQAQYAARGSEGAELTGDALRNTVGQAIGERPDQLPPEDESTAARDARLAAGLDHGYYGDETRAAGLAKTIEDVGGEGASVSVVPVAVTSNDFGVAAFNVFRVERADGEVRFVDDQGLVYRDFDHWRSKNELPPGRTSYPEGLEPGADLVEPENTRRVVDTVGERLGQVLDYAAIGVGVVAGAAIIVGTGGTAAIIAAGAAGAYTAGRAGAEIYDDHQRGVDVLDFSNPENRAQWLEVAAGALSVGAIGSGLRVANAARQGVQVGTTLSRTAAGLAIAADTADALAMTDQAVSLAVNWSDMSNGDRAMGMLNIAFWGGMGVASARAGGGDLRDAFSFTRLDSTFRTGTPYPMQEVPGLQPGEMRVSYTEANGRAGDIVIETGPGPVDPAALARHTETARAMEASGGLRDRFNALIGGETPPVGSAAWEADLEIRKITAESQAIAAEQAAPGLTPARAAELEVRQHELAEAINREQVRLTNAAADPNGFGAAPRSLTDITNAYVTSGDISRGLPPGYASVSVPSAGAPATVSYLPVNADGQALGITATIDQSMLDTGTRADPNIGPPGFIHGDYNHSRGHLLARMLGGDGGDERNLVTLFQVDTNSPVMGSFEDAVYQAVDAGEVVNYSVTPVYEGGSRPVALAISARGSGGFSLDITLHNVDGTNGLGR